MVKFKKISFFIFLIFICGSLLCSCEYKNIVMLNPIDDENVIKSTEDNEEEEFSVYSQDFFLAQKEKQIDKNILNDINVRKAIFYAIDRERIVDELYGEYNNVADSLFQEGSFYNSQSWSQYEYDPDKAEEFLNIAGYGTDNPLYITIGSISDSGTKEMIEEIIKENLDKIGIKVWIFNKPSEEWYGDCVGKGEYELGIWSFYNFDGSSLNCSFNSGKIPSLATEENKNCENFYWYDNQEVDSILKNIENENNIDEKKELFNKLQDIIATDAVVLPLYNRMYTVVFNSKKIKNIVASIRNNEIFFNLEKSTLSGGWQSEDSEKNEIIIGCKGEDYSLTDLLNEDYISDLIVKGLWEINENGEYDCILAATDSCQGYSSTGVYEKKVKVVLKDGIFWENGEPITSKDVKYTFDSIVENEELIKINRDYLEIEEIEIINEKEFNIVFKGYIGDYGELFKFLIPDGLLGEKDISNFSIKDIVSNGPFKLNEHVRGKYVLLEKNDYYFNEIPDIDRIRIVFDTDINNLINMLKDGEVDILSVPFDIGMVKEFEESEDFGLLVMPGNMIEHIAVCLKPRGK
jgi:ABC-type transport system substrate-binding protein